MLLTSDELKQKIASFADNLRAGKGIIVFDYDGTVSPHVEDPMEAYPDLLVRQQLLSINKRCPGSVICLTGRPINDFDQLFWHGFKGEKRQLNVIGEHGMRARINGELQDLIKLSDAESQFIDQVAKNIFNKVNVVFEDASLSNAEIKALIEIKPSAIALHTRPLLNKFREKRLAEINSKFKVILDQLVLPRSGIGRFSVLAGDMNNELCLAPKHVNKGAAIRWILKHAETGKSATNILFLCDDLCRANGARGTDSYAAEVVNEINKAPNDLRSGLVLQVRKPSIKPASEEAVYAPQVVVETPADLGEFLKALDKRLSASSSVEAASNTGLHKNPDKQNLSTEAMATCTKSS